MTATRITTTRNGGGLAAAIVLVLTLSWPAHVAAAGTHEWDVWGVGVYSENAVCPQ